MRSRQARLALCAVGLACLTGLAAAGPMTLRLKLKPNETMRYRCHLEMSGATTTQGVAGESGAVPVQMVVTAEATAKVLAVDEAGQGRLAVKADKAEMSANLMGQPAKVTFANGKAAVSGAAAGPLAEMLRQQAAALQQTFTVTLDCRGKIVQVQIPPAAAQQAQAVLGGVDPTTAVQQGQPTLPEKPVSVGDTWTDRQSLPIGGQPVVCDSTYRLAGVETKNGHTLARIKVSSTSRLDNADLADLAAPPGAPPVQGTMSMRQQAAGTVLFDVTAGRLARYDFSVSQTTTSAMRIAMPGQPAQSMSSNSSVTMKGALAAL